VAPKEQAGLGLEFKPVKSGNDGSWRRQKSDTVDPDMATQTMPMRESAIRIAWFPFEFTFTRCTPYSMAVFAIVTGTKTVRDTIYTHMVNALRM
jgi:hypothetical protein